MTNKDIMRRLILEDIYKKLSPDERRIIIESNREHTEIMAALQQQRDIMDDLSRRMERFPFASNLLSSVTGNFIAYFAIKLLNK